MKVAVKDACILMDLVNGGLLSAWFQLGVETWTTDLVLRQVKKESQWPVVEALAATGALKVRSFDAVELATLHDFHAASLGLEDQSVLYVAHDLHAILLTGDRRLRAEAGRLNVAVTGLLGILDLLVERSVLPALEAAERLEAMLQQGAFLPATECRKRLVFWRQS